MITTLIDNGITFFGLKTKKVIVPTNNIGWNIFRSIMNRIEYTVDCGEMSFMNAAIGDELRSAYQNWEKFAQKYQITVYHNNELHAAANIRFVLHERETIIEKEFNFSF